MFGVQSNCVLCHVTCARYSDNYYAVAKVRQFKPGYSRMCEKLTASVPCGIFKTVTVNQKLRNQNERSKQTHQNNICRGN